MLTNLAALAFVAGNLLWPLAVVFGALPGRNG